MHSWVSVSAFSKRSREKQRKQSCLFKRSIIAKKLKDLEATISETIYLELTLSKKKQFDIFAYWPYNNYYKRDFFQWIAHFLSSFPVFELLLKTWKFFKTFHNHYINIVKKSPDIPPNAKGNLNSPFEDCNMKNSKPNSATTKKITTK